MTGINKGPQTVGDIIYQCARSWLPCGVPLDLAIEAHTQAMRHPDPHVGYMALMVITMACRPDLAADRKYLDAVAALPDDAWAGFPDPAEGQREVLAMARRAVAWQVAS